MPQPSLVQWAFPKIGVPQNGWFIRENLILLDDFGVPLFLETPRELGLFFMQKKLTGCRKLVTGSMIISFP